MILLFKDLRRLSKLYTQTIAKELPEPHTEYLAEIILHLSSLSAPVTQKELTEHLQVDKSRMAFMIEELKKLKYLSTQRNPADRREHFVSLSEYGRQLVPIIRRTVDKVNRMTCQQLDNKQIDCFYKTVLQMQTNLLDRSV